MGCFENDPLVLDDVVDSNIDVINHDLPLVVLVEIQLLEVGWDLQVAIDDGFKLTHINFIFHMQRKTLLNTEFKVLQVLYFNSHFNIIILNANKV